MRVCVRGNRAVRKQISVVVVVEPHKHTLAHTHTHHTLMHLYTLFSIYRKTQEILIILLLPSSPHTAQYTLVAVAALQCFLLKTHKPTPTILSGRGANKHNQIACRTYPGSEEARLQ